VDTGWEIVESGPAGAEQTFLLLPGGRAARVRSQRSERVRSDRWSLLSRCSTCSLACGAVGRRRCDRQETGGWRPGSQVSSYRAAGTRIGPSPCSTSRDVLLRRERGDLHVEEEEVDPVRGVLADRRADREEHPPGELGDIVDHEEAADRAGSTGWSTTRLGARLTVRPDASGPAEPLEARRGTASSVPRRRPQRCRRRL
jgi:hypothetical protein